MRVAVVVGLVVAGCHGGGHPAAGDALGTVGDASAGSDSASDSAPADAPVDAEHQLTEAAGLFQLVVLTAPYSGASIALPAFPSQLSTLMFTPAQLEFLQVDLWSYAGKVYHDALVGQVGDAPSWHTGA
ncbi:MAG TPA: hypothetical protein VMJ10_05105 [Kofleriaceae bacterium]|nr:hypothetical protein [Kofleriaceae bacterium]